MIGIVDYGVGNLFSLRSSFAAIGQEVTVSRSASELAACDRLVLPGVGAFADAARLLRETGMADFVLSEVAAGKPLLGICLGMQLLFEKSFEYGEHLGLGLIPGAVRPIAETIPVGLDVPHIGWNALHFVKRIPLFRYVNEGDYVYFVHSYHGTGCEESTVATTEYGAPLVAAVAHGHIMGCQFHPEKSGAVGLSILRAFAEEETC
ncbi:MAG: imidazole glycerol phosphate synthase subunit HisH [Clostridia bacterium]|nr:imidazole glycerol phosphate synthase subunit HisH [Clostridia bacterium]